MNGMLNGLPVDPDNYVIGVDAQEDMEAPMGNIGDKGVAMHPVCRQFDEHNMRDGSIRCATQQLLRVSS
jgi:hypothetical protein